MAHRNSNLRRLRLAIEECVVRSDKGEVFFFFLKKNNINGGMRRAGWFGVMRCHSKCF